MCYWEHVAGAWALTVQEMFIQYLTEQGQNVVRSERKPRKNIQYRDLGMICNLPQ